MSKGYNLGDLRAAIEQANREVMSESGNGQASNTAVLERLKKRDVLISSFTPQLVDIALIKLLNQVSRQSAANNIENDQYSLFDGYRKIPRRITVVRGLKMKTEQLSLAEAEEWLENRSRQVAVDEYEDFRKLISECKLFAKSDNETIEQILIRKNQPPKQENFLD